LSSIGTGGLARSGIQARKDDEAERSLAVHVPNDPGRDELLRTFPADAGAGKPTTVFVKGKIFTFAAPANLRRYTRPYMDVQSSRDIGFQPTVEH